MVPFCDQSEDVDEPWTEKRCSSAGKTLGGCESVTTRSRGGTNVGLIAQLHLFLDDIDPHGIGKPIFGNAVQPTPLFRN